MKGVWQLKGLEEYLGRVAQAGVDVDPATMHAVDAGADVALAGMRQRVRKRTGALAERLGRSEVIQDGNIFYVHVGLLDLGRPLKNYGAQRADKKLRGKNRKQWPREFLYGVFQEFGSAKMKAQPYVRPTFDLDKSKIRAAEVESLKQDGMI